MSRRRAIGLVLLGLVVYAGTLVMTLPAGRALDWAQPQGVRVEVPEGRLWAGSARRIHVDALPVALGDVSWDFHAVRLLLGELGGAIAAEVAGIEARGRVAVTGRRALRLNDVTLRGPVAGLVEQLPYPVAASGSLLARIEQGSVEQGLPHGFRGRAVWSDARLQAPMALALGEVAVDIEPDGDGQSITVRAGGGELEANGEILLQANGDFSVEMTLKPTERAGSGVRDTLNLLARPDDQGRYILRQNGSLR